MGKQVNFYMAGADELDFIRFARSDREVGLFGYGLPSDEIVLLDELPSPKEPGWFHVWLWDMANSPRPVLRFVREQRHYVVDPFASEVVEFSRSILDGQCLSRGRIWAEMIGWRMDDPLHTFRKPGTFVRWFRRLGSWLTRRSMSTSDGGYLLPGAQEHVDGGGMLSQLFFAE